MPQPYDLMVFVSEYYYSFGSGDLPKGCCETRLGWIADVHVNKIKGKGYILTIAPKDVGMFLSHLTGAKTLWLTATFEEGKERFFFRVAGFEEIYDKTIYLRK